VDGTTTGQAGAVVQVFSRSGRLDPVEHRLFYQGAPGVGGTPTEWETFGAALPGSADYFD
jgi:hypothetical protein